MIQNREKILALLGSLQQSVMTDQWGQAEADKAVALAAAMVPDQAPIDMLSEPARRDWDLCARAAVLAPTTGATTLRSASALEIDGLMRVVRGHKPARPSPYLCHFYDVTTFPALVNAMEDHILRLQSKLPRDNRPALVAVRGG